MRKAGLLGCALVLSATVLAAQDQSSNPSNASPQSPVPTAQPQTPAPPDQAAAPSAQTDTAAPQFARLHVYRQRRYAGSALAPTVVVDGKQVARVGNGRRVTIKLTAGPHTIASDDKSSAISVDAKPGQDYYVRVDEEMGFWKGHGKLTMLMPEQGSAEYKLQKPIEPDRKVAKEMIEDDETQAAPPEKTNQ